MCSDEEIVKNEEENAKQVLPYDQRQADQWILLPTGMEIYTAVHLRNMEAFICYINKDGNNLNQPLGIEGRTASMQLLTMPYCFEYTRLALENGANLDIRDKKGRSHLHIAALSTGVQNARAAALTVLKGLDIDDQDAEGKTALYTACENGNIALMGVCQYFSANPCLTSYLGLLPINEFVRFESSELSHYEVLFQQLCYYTFMRGDSVTLSALLDAMTHDSLFTFMVEHELEVICDEVGIYQFYFKFTSMQYRHYIVMFERYKNVIQICLETFNPVKLVFESRRNLNELSQILEHLLESEYAATVVQNTDAEKSIISGYMRFFHDRYNAEQMENNIYSLLSYGAAVTTDDLQSVYEKFGYEKLFKFMLDMEDIMHLDQDNLDAIVRLYYNPHLTVDTCLNSGNANVLELLYYFNNSELKEICLNNCEADRIERMRAMPDVSTLVELSRDASRNYIINTYRTRTAKQFNRALKQLKIPEKAKLQIAFEDKLY